MKRNIHIQILAYKVQFLAILTLTSLILGRNLDAQISRSSVVTRAEAALAIILSQVNDFPAIRNDGQFSDIQKGAWHEPYMLYAESLGIISPNDQGFLRPGSILNRAEFLKMLTVAFDLPQYTTYSFTDVEPGSWYEEYAGLASHSTIFQLQNSELLEPHQPVLRSEMEDAITFFKSVVDREIALDNMHQSAGPLLYTVTSIRRQPVVFEDLTLSQSSNALAPTSVINVVAARAEIVDRMNVIRTSYGLKPVRQNALLELSAQRFAQQMITERFFSHTSPGGETLKDRVTISGYYNRMFNADCRCIYGYALGENLARGQRTPEEVIAAWMDSPSHRATMLNPDYTDIGIGISSDIWVQHFGGILAPTAAQ